MGIHDSNHFEVKLDYSIRPEQKTNHYSIEAYFFIPRSLGVNPYTYSREQFYSDIQAYIRFKTPHLSLKSIADTNDKHSPLYRIEAKLPSLRAEPRQHRRLLETLSYEMRLLGCLVRANVRDRSRMITSTVRRGTSDSPFIDNLTSTFLQDLTPVFTRFRALRSVFAEPLVPRWILETYEYVDEYLGIVLETHLTGLLENFDTCEKSQDLKKSREQLVDALVAERQYRKNAGYPSVLTVGEPNETYVYRRGLLKKFVMSVLFLEISKEKQGQRVQDVGAAIAAGVAMLFAALSAIFAQTRYGMNTTPFIIALVVSYILKDRIKDWLKSYFAHKLTRFLADYSVDIQDPSNETVIGRCREVFSFIRRSQIPMDVFAFRHRDAVTSIEADSKPEVVLRYQKDVRIKSATIGTLHQRLHDINDIIRFNIANFLVRTDDAVQEVKYFDPDNNRVDEMLCPKVYHINLILVLRAKDKDVPPVIERVRVVLDKNGIKRLEEA